jgi:hypothetical protein
MMPEIQPMKTLWEPMDAVLVTTRKDGDWLGIYLGKDAAGLSVGAIENLHIFASYPPSMVLFPWATVGRVQSLEGVVHFSHSSGTIYMEHYASRIAEARERFRR